MADWKQVNWDTTWGNKKYRAGVLLAIMSVIAGGLGTIMTFVGHDWSWVIFILHGIFIHVMCFGLANEK